MTIQLIQGDCLDKMKEIPDGIVDLVLCDPPYGTMKGIGSDKINYGMVGKTEWDNEINPKDFFPEINRVLRMNGAVVLFSQEPYTSKLITEAHGNIPFSYRMIWKKDHFANALIAKKAPVSYFEDILVFFKTYDTDGLHPLRQYVQRIIRHVGRPKKEIFQEMGHQGICHFWRYDSMQFDLCTEKTYRQLIDIYGIDRVEGFIEYSELKTIHERFKRRFNLPQGAKYKSNILEYKKDYNGFHPTQKPVKLIQDLVYTYSNEGDMVLDFTMGSGTTGVACKNLNRNFIGIEMDEGYFEIAKNRIANIDNEK